MEKVPDLKKIFALIILFTLTAPAGAAKKNVEYNYVDIARVQEALDLLNEAAELFELDKKDEYEKKREQAVTILKEEFQVGKYFTVKQDCPFVKGQDMIHENFHLACMTYNDEKGGLVFFMNKTWSWVKKKFGKLENGESFTAVIRITTSGIGRLGRTFRPWVVLEDKSRVEVFCKIVKVLSEDKEKPDEISGEDEQ